MKSRLFDHQWEDLAILSNDLTPEAPYPKRKDFLILVNPTSNPKELSAYSVEALHEEEALDFFYEETAIEDSEFLDIFAMPFEDATDELLATLGRITHIIPDYIFTEVLNDLNKENNHE